MRRHLHMQVVLPMFLLFGSIADTSRAFGSEFCQELDRLSRNAVYEPVTRQTYLIGLDFPGNCAPVLGLGGVRSMSCRWDFEYRADAANQTLLEMFGKLQECALDNTQVEHDQSVNHPDFYELKIVKTRAGEVGLSLKDKGAAQKTLIFLRVTPN